VVKISHNLIVLSKLPDVAMIINRLSLEKTIDTTELL